MTLILDSDLWMYDMVNKTKDFTKEQLINDIQNHIENYKYKG